MKEVRQENQRSQLAERTTRSDGEIFDFEQWLSQVKPQLLASLSKKKEQNNAKYSGSHSSEAHDDG